MHLLNLIILMMYLNLILLFPNLSMRQVNTNIMYKIVKFKKLIFEIIKYYCILYHISLLLYNNIIAEVIKPNEIHLLIATQIFKTW